MIPQTISTPGRRFRRGCRAERHREGTVITEQDELGHGMWKP